jgi:hypothetical protein
VVSAVKVQQALQEPLTQDQVAVVVALPLVVTLIGLEVTAVLG